MSLSLQAEQIETIAAHLLRRRDMEHCRATAICAVSSGEGATFLAVRLASAIAQRGIKTALVDLDIAEPGVGELVKTDPEVPGAARLLTSDELEIGAAVQETSQPNLMVIQAGSGGSEIGDLLGRQRFRRLMEDCMRRFEFTIVDTPPANRSASLLHIVDAVGYAVVVARRDRAYMDDVATLSRQIRETGAVLLGSVLVEA